MLINKLDMKKCQSEGQMMLKIFLGNREVGYMNMSWEGDKDKRVDRGYKIKRSVDPCLVTLHPFLVTCTKLKKINVKYKL